MSSSKPQTNPNSLANLKGHEFKKGQSGNPAGRKKAVIKEMMKKFTTQTRIRQLSDFSKEEINDIEKKMPTLTISELTTLAKADETPAYVRTLAMAIITDIKNGKTTTVDRLIERQYGKAVTPIDVTSQGKPINSQVMTQEQARDYLAGLDKNF